MINNNKLLNFFNLSFSLAKAEFKLRNENSYLGVLWYLLYPLLMFTVLFVVFSFNLGKDIEFYSIYLLLGIIMYNFFSQVTMNSILNIRDNRVLIKSIKFPKEALIASNLFRNIFSHMFEIIVFVIIILILGISVKGLIFYIPIFVFFSIFIYGCSLIISSLYIYFSDIEFIWSFFIRLLFFATPIFYSLEGRSITSIINLFNPLYYFIKVTRDIIIYNIMPELNLVLGMILYSLIFLILGLIIFNRLKNKFAELL